MEALRIVMTQASANYRKEESDRNRMTYPLPPFSTIIGAIHKTCGFTQYHPMEISVQGNYQSMHKEPYTDYCFLNTVMDDRGILVKLSNESMLTAAFTKVAAAKKSQGNSFKKGVTIDVFDEALLEEYRNLITLREQLDDFKKTRISRIMNLIKKRKNTLKQEKKNAPKGSELYNQLDEREREIKQGEEEIKSRLKTYENEYFTIPYTRFKSLTTSLKYYEILDEIRLIIHVKADRELLDIILENIYSLKALGRSEDFVEVKEAEIVDLQTCQEEVVSQYTAYLNYDDVVVHDNILTRQDKSKEICGTKYYINKDYTYEKEKKTRRFNKCKVIYASQYSVDEESTNVWIDKAEGIQYIVNFM